MALSGQPDSSEARPRVGWRDGRNLLSPPPLPPVIIQHAVWLYLRFTLSYRDLEELLAERGLDISYETVRYWGIEIWPGGQIGGLFTFDRSAEKRHACGRMATKAAVPFALE